MTPAHETSKGFNVENLALPLRLILPVLMAIFFYVYSQDQNREHSDFTDVKNGQDKTWNAIQTVNSKIDAVKDKEASDFNYVLENYVRPNKGG